MNRPILVTGPARSGKSAWAEALAVQSGKPVIYVATAFLDGADAEWLARIELHRHRRPAGWTTLEVPVDLVATLSVAPPDCCLLIDSLGTWVANLLHLDEAAWERTQLQLMACLAGGGRGDPAPTGGEVIFVAEETGWGVVPAYPSGRLFRDRLGSLLRRLGAIANPVYLVTGGHVLNLSSLGSPLPPTIF